jgi:hypothetical protein
MNTFLNENWKELLRDLGTPFAETSSEISKTIVLNILELVPFDEVFPQTV